MSGFEMFDESRFGGWQLRSVLDNVFAERERRSVINSLYC